MNKGEYIAAFRRLAAEQLDEDASRAIMSILDTAAPRNIFDALDRLRVEGKMQGEDFEKLLTDFFWLFCY